MYGQLNMVQPWYAVTYSEACTVNDSSTVYPTDENSRIELYNWQ